MCLKHSTNPIVHENHKVSYVPLFSSYFVFKCENEMIIACANFVCPCVFIYLVSCVQPCNMWFNSLFIICHCLLLTHLLSIQIHYFSLCIFAYSRISHCGLFFKDFSWIHLKILHVC
jgi:hypothetical protein